MKLFISILVSLQLLSFQSQACSAFATKGALAPLFAKQYDWEVGHGMVIVNKRKVSKKALLLFGGVPVEWTSRYGNITFNQHGREFPLGGINEQGLAIEILWLPETQFPDQDATPSVNEAQWIQYQLDTAGSVQEAMAQAKSIAINPVFAKTHYMACDKSGVCASFEYIDGKLVTQIMSETVMTNSAYNESVSTLKNYKGFGGNKSIPMSGYSSMDRFVRLAHVKKDLVNITNPQERMKKSFETLTTVRSVQHSRWQIAYDMSSDKITFRKWDPSNNPMKTIDIKSFDFDCRSPVMTLDMAISGSGDVTNKFVVFSKQENYDMVLTSARQAGLPEAFAQIVSDYVDSTSCR